MSKHYTFWSFSLDSWKKKILNIDICFLKSIFYWIHTFKTLKNPNNARIIEILQLKLVIPSNPYHILGKLELKNMTKKSSQKNFQKNHYFARCKRKNEILPTFCLIVGLAYGRRRSTFGMMFYKYLSTYIPKISHLRIFSAICQIYC